VLAESFERIHRSNLVGMGVMPLQFKAGEGRKSLALDGSETFALPPQTSPLQAGQDLELKVTRSDGSQQTLQVTCRLDTGNEIAYFQSAGILNYVLRRLVS